MLGYDRVVKASVELTLDPEKPKGQMVMSVDMLDHNGGSWKMRVPWEIDRTRPKSENGKVASFEDMNGLVRDFGKLMQYHPMIPLSETESPIELQFLFHAMHKIKNLEPQVRVGPFRVDLAVRGKKVAIELDGHQYHSSPKQRTHDAARRRYLQRKGWRVIVFTGTEIQTDVMGCVKEAKQIIERRPDVNVTITP